MTDREFGSDPNPAPDTIVGRAAELHHRDPFAAVDRLDGPPPGERWVVCDLTEPAIILGSRQSADSVDESAATVARFDVTRRRSGGGAVVLCPGDHVWIDTVSEPGVFPDDVRASMVAVGQRWRRVLSDLSPVVTATGTGRADPVSSPQLTVHDGGVTHTRWSEQICFAGVGPGEVLLDGRKLVGLSQRRSRQGAWIQATVYRRRQPYDVGSMLRPSVDWAALPPIATLADLGLGEIDATVLAQALAAR